MPNSCFTRSCVQAVTLQLQPKQAEVSHALALPVAAAAVQVVYERLWEDARDAAGQVNFYIVVLV